MPVNPAAYERTSKIIQDLEKQINKMELRLEGLRLGYQFAWDIRKKQEAEMRSDAIANQAATAPDKEGIQSNNPPVDSTGTVEQNIATSHSHNVPLGDGKPVQMANVIENGEPVQMTGFPVRDK